MMLFCQFSYGGHGVGLHLQATHGLGCNGVDLVDGRVAVARHDGHVDIAAVQIGHLAEVCNLVGGRQTVYEGQLARVSIEDSQFCGYITAFREGTVVHAEQEIVASCVPAAQERFAAALCLNAVIIVGIKLGGSGLDAHYACIELGLLARVGQCRFAGYSPWCRDRPVLLRHRWSGSQIHLNSRG